MCPIWDKISNYKVSIKYTLFGNTIDSKLHNISIRKKGTSFYIFKLGDYTYSVYSKGHINITGLKTIRDIFQSIKQIENVLNMSITHFNIDNVTYSDKLKTPVTTYSFVDLLHFIKQSNKFTSVQYSAQKFPGAFLKLIQFGTIILFSSGKYTLVGCNSISKISYLQTILKELCNEFYS